MAQTKKYTNISIPIYFDKRTTQSQQENMEQLFLQLFEKESMSIHFLFLNQCVLQLQKKAHAIRVISTRPFLFESIYPTFSHHFQNCFSQSWIYSLLQHALSFKTFPGIPATKDFSGMSLRINVIALIKESLPIVTPFSTVPLFQRLPQETPDCMRQCR